MRFHNLDLNSLVVLDKLLSEASVSHAATQLHMSQPAVSNTLARLRRHFGDDLFLHDGRRMVPTPFAEVMRAPLREMIDGLASLATYRASFEPATAERVFTILTSDQAYMTVLAPAVRALALAAPGVCLRALLSSDERVELLAKGIVDFAILPSMQRIAAHPALELFDDLGVFVAWSGNDRVGDPLTLDDLCRVGHVDTTMRSTPRPIEAALAERGLQRRIAAYAPTFALVADTVVGTDYLGWMGARPAAMLAQRLPIKVLAPPVDVSPMTLLLQWRAAMDADPGVVWMRQFLAGIAAAEIPAITK
jgi:LysR family nod box-dependent transcriptional activator